MKDDDLCNICGRIPEAIVKVYANEPFVDGRNYGLICWVCANVPKTWYYDNNGEIIVLEYFDKDRINTAKEMSEDGGWDKDEAEISIKAIRKLLKRPKIRFESDQETHIFEQLIFGENIEMELNI